MFDSSQLGSQPSNSQIIHKQLCLQGKWLITTARSVHQDLLALDDLLHSDAAIEGIDCTQVDAIDLAGIQLLIAIKKQHTASPLAVQGNAQTQEWLSLCGLAEPLVSCHAV